MNKVKQLGLLVLAVCALGAVMASSAFAALPTILPGTGLTISGSGGEGTLRTLAGTEVVCTGNTAEVKFAANTNLAPVHISFTACKSPTLGGAKCTGLTDTASSGTILALGEIHLVFDKLGSGTSLGVAGLFLIEELGFECGALATVKVKGSVLCLISPINVKVKTTETATLKCEELPPKTGDPKETEYWNAAGEKQAPLLLTSINGGTFESSAENAEAKLKATTEYELMG
jgi:hypothetical protein